MRSAVGGHVQEMHVAWYLKQVLGMRKYLGTNYEQKFPLFSCAFKLLLLYAPEQTSSLLIIYTKSPGL